MTQPLVAGRYQIVRPLGHGAFAETVLAHDTVLDTMVAIKVLHPRAAKDWKAFELFEREAKVLAGLRHHGVPAVLASLRATWEGSDAALLVMEYIEGPSLAEVIAQQRVGSPDDLMHTFVELLGVLEYLHGRVPPVLHRDIKPANIIIRPDGTPALVDFGAVRNVFHAADESGSTIVGTYGYMPYEQMMGQSSPASDLYALAATFLHLSTGRAPPEFMNAAGQLQVPEALPGPERFRTVLARMLASSPAERFQAAREVRMALLFAEPTPHQSALPVAAGSAGEIASVRTRMPVLQLPRTPRALEGETAALRDRVAYRAWDLLAPNERPGERPRPTTVMGVVLVSFLSIGILPAVFWGRQFARRRRLKPFLIDGIPAVARVIDMTPEDIGYRKELMRVRYAFDVDGERFVDADEVLPFIARKWEPGTAIQILYLPQQGHESVIVSTS